MMLERLRYRLPLLLVIATVFMLIFPSESSPMKPGIHFDLYIFLNIADAWQQGLLPFRDIFDSKGPYVFAINYLGLLLTPHDKLGIWLIEVATFTLILEQFYRLGRLLGASVKRIIAGMGMVLTIFIFTICYGDSVEFWSLPFVMLALCFTARCYRSDTLYTSAWLPFVLGLCMGVVAFIRLNNCAIIIGLALGLAWMYARRGLYSRLLRAILLFLAGTAVSAAPVMIYFACHGALYDMLFAGFIYNFGYLEMKNSQNSGTWRNSLLMLSAVIAIIGAWRNDKRNHTSWTPLIVGIGVVTILAFMRGQTYNHYFTMTLPLIFIAVVWVGSFNRSVQAAMCLAIALPFIIIFWAPGTQSPRVFFYGLRHPGWFAQIERNEQLLLNKCYGLIPEASRDSIYLYEAPLAGYFYKEGVMPIGKYFFLNEMHTIISEEARADVLAHFNKARPRYIFIGYGHDIDEGYLAPYSSEYERYNNPSDTVGVNRFPIYRRRDLPAGE